MNTTIRAIAPFAFATVLIGGTAVNIGQAQPAPNVQPADVDHFKREIDRLQARVKQLEADNAKLVQRIKDMQARSGTRAEDPSAAAPIPADPLAAPVSMLSELIKRYDRELASVPRSSPTQMERFKEQSQKWCKEMSAELRGKSKWLVKLSDVREISALKTDGLVQVLDPDTLNPIGEPVRFEIPGRFAERIKSVERAKGLSETTWELTAGIQADPKFNSDRPDVGVFNVPAFVGPYVEFGIRLDWQALAEAELPATPPGEKTKDSTPARPDPGTPR